jgi:hypothetical protein
MDKRRRVLFEIRHTTDYILRIYESDLNWEDKFDLIFSPYASQSLTLQLKAFGLEIDWTDPDTSYQEDVTAYIRGLEKIVPVLGVLEKATNEN